MSNSPMLPGNVSLGSPQKSFWQRPEGKVGAIVLAGIGIGAALMFWGAILPWMIMMVSSTLTLIYLCAILAAILFVLTNKTIHARVGLIFRLTMRYLTGLIINIDPIGILKDHILQMKKKKEELDAQIGQVSGQLQRLKSIIAKNATEADKNFRMAEQARKMSAEATDPLEKMHMDAQVSLNSKHAGRLGEANVGYQGLLNKLTTVYTLLSKWAINIDYFIEDTEDQVRQAEVTKATVDSGYGALKSAMAIIKGNADENDIYDTTMQRLAEDADRKLGEIDDFQRVAQNFMDGMDVENGAAQQQALDQLNQYEKKMLTSGDPDTQFLKPGAVQQKVPVLAAGQQPNASGYGDMFKKP